MKKNSSQSNEQIKKESISENTIPIKENTLDAKSSAAKREVSLILDLFTRIIKKEDIEKCICHPFLEKVDNVSVFHENELVTGIQVTQNKDNQIKFEEVVSGLRMLGYPVTGSLISIYCSKIDDFIYLGAEPLDANLVLDCSEFQNLYLLRIKMTAFIEEKILVKQTSFGQILEENENVNNSLAALNNVNSNKNSQMQGKTNLDNSSGLAKEDKKVLNVNKRTKERKIGFIIEKVNTWRKYYNGYYDEKGNFTKFSLDEAAKKIDISKKSLDDYLLQLRLGRTYGFDFNANKNSKVGILRAFVKEKRKKI